MTNKTTTTTISKVRSSNRGGRPRKYEVDPRPTDILLGRGNGVAIWRGNINFRNIVLDYRTEYKQAGRFGKGKVALKVLSHISKLNPPGRFVEMIAEDQFYVVPKHRAIEKICQALREKKYKDIVPERPLPMQGTSNAPSSSQATAIKLHQMTPSKVPSLVMSNIPSVTPALPSTANIPTSSSKSLVSTEPKKKDKPKVVTPINICYLAEKDMHGMVAIESRALRPTNVIQDPPHRHCQRVLDFSSGGSAPRSEHKVFMELAPKTATTNCQDEKVLDYVPSTPMKKTMTGNAIPNEVQVTRRSPKHVEFCENDFTLSKAKNLTENQPYFFDTWTTTRFSDNHEKMALYPDPIEKLMAADKCGKYDDTQLQSLMSWFNTIESTIQPKDNQDLDITSDENMVIEECSCMVRPISGSPRTVLLNTIEEARSMAQTVVGYSSMWHPTRSSSTKSPEFLKSSSMNPNSGCPELNYEYDDITVIGDSFDEALNIMGEDYSEPWIIPSS